MECQGQNIRVNQYKEIILENTSISNAVFFPAEKSDIPKFMK